MRTRLNLTAFGRRSRAVIIVACLAYAAAASGQDAGSADASPAEPISADEEVVVLGQNLGIMRERIRLAEEAVYAKFNELNSNDDYDIHCRYSAPTGSRIRRRVCEPNFWRDIQAEASEEMARALQGGIAIPPAMIYAPAKRQGELMTREMLRLMVENAEFHQTLTELGALVQASRRERPLSRSSALVLTEGFLGEGVLPYGAASLVQVRVGRRPWKYDLEHRTFAVGRVSGRIDEIEIRCRGVTELLVYDVGAEWTLPDDWQSCELRVDATQGTTFSFYGFE